MFTEIFAIGALAFMLCVMVWQAVRVCSREQSLRSATPIVIASSLVWAVATLNGLYVGINDSDFNDGTIHEIEARVVASRLLDGGLQPAEYFVVGNKAYRLLLGSFYAITDASPWVIYGFNGMVGFIGMLLTLSSICRYFECRRCPVWFVVLSLLLPSCLAWAPLNLKEGGLLFGIGLVLNGILYPPSSARTIGSKAGLFIGGILVFFLRPHIAAAWLCGLVFGFVQPTQSLGKAVIACLVFGVVGIGAFCAIELARPGFIQGVADDGLTGSLDAGFQSRKTIGSTAIYQQSNPIPVVTGLLILALSPPPQFWGSPAWLILGLESLTLTLLLVHGWLLRRLPSRLRLLRMPMVVGSIYVVIFIAFHLSYSYNMGLAVRQKMMAIPAILLLIAGPVFYSQKVAREHAVGVAREGS
ncbi:hypothetical protein SAMN06265222_103323 [Neorhodopirellula lusitana]|uniref:DUF2029 domain-containing protein n=1 Tax=Neorhodopirellula lusitana TaxID=445327 RepID=A0ABY1PX00_9BACT|nr:hypothetical protein [Neorhodopirellula lusitana]SMP51680.1 hypothetical protein SAMN06265222_103323 [Neorhodopirellula lusitana]